VRGGPGLWLQLRRPQVLTLLRRRAPHAGKLVLVVTHGGVLQAVHWLARGYHAPDKMRNGALNMLHVEGGKWALEVWNDARHLGGSGEGLAGGGVSGL
jgi:broad specificity phosphatase PhoE